MCVCVYVCRCKCVCVCVCVCAVRKIDSLYFRVANYTPPCELLCGEKVSFIVHGVSCMAVSCVVEYVNLSSVFMKTCWD